MKGPERWHLEKKVKHFNAGLKTEGLYGNMEGGYPFCWKTQSSETFVSLCVARCLHKHMNKNKNDWENGIYVAHERRNRVRVGLLTLHYSARVPLNPYMC